MINNLGFNKVLWIINGLLSMAAALIGVFHNDIYSGIVSKDVLPGVISQDIITIVAAVILLCLAFMVKESNTKLHIIILSILGYIFYAYGIYVLELFYSWFYFLYMLIFALSFYSLVYGVVCVRKEVLQEVHLSKVVRYGAVAFSIIIPLMFYALWTSQLIPLIQTATKPEFMYSIYILDMCFIFPAFGIIAYLTARNRGLGLLLIPVMFIKGFTLLFSVGLGGAIRPYFDMAVNTGDTWFYFGVAFFFLFLSAIYLRSLKIGDALK